MQGSEGGGPEDIVYEEGLWEMGLHAGEWRGRWYLKGEYVIG